MVPEENDIRSRSTQSQGETTDSAELHPSASEEQNQIEKLEAELEKLPKAGKRLAIHLNEEMRTRLIDLCEEQKLTPEMLLEGILVVLLSHPDLLEEALREGRERLAVRKRVGLIKRTLSVLRRI